MIEAEGGAASAYEADITDEAACQAIAAEAEARLGRIDILHNNVGVGGRDNSITNLEADVFDRIMTTNLKAMWLSKPSCRDARAVRRQGRQHRRWRRWRPQPDRRHVKAGVGKLPRATAAGSTRT